MDLLGKQTMWPGMLAAKPKIGKNKNQSQNNLNWFLFLLILGELS
jgi:hypothetical protein